VWSWGWGTFDSAGADPDKPKAACVYLWTRDPTLCDGPAEAGPRFNASLTLGQIRLAPGVQCRTRFGAIETAPFEELAAAFGNRQAALTVLLNRLVYLDEGVDPPPSDVVYAEQSVVAREFGGDMASYEAALTQAGLTRKVARELIADQLRRQQFEAVVQVRYLAASGRGFTVDRQRAALRTAICLADELPGPGVAEITDRLPILAIRNASISIAADRYRAKRGARVMLHGAVDSDRAFELVTIYARRSSASSYTRLGTVRVRPGSSWSFQVRPQASTYYRAVSKSAASALIALRVH
jgi:hypothetical protein